MTPKRLLIACHREGNGIYRDRLDEVPVELEGIARHLLAAQDTGHQIKGELIRFVVHHVLGSKGIHVGVDGIEQVQRDAQNEGILEHEQQ